MQNVGQKLNSYIFRTEFGQIMDFRGSEFWPLGIQNKKTLASHGGGTENYACLIRRRGLGGKRILARG